MESNRAAARAILSMLNGASLLQSFRRRAA